MNAIRRKKLEKVLRKYGETYEIYRGSRESGEIVGNINGYLYYSAYGSARSRLAIEIAGITSVGREPRLMAYINHTLSCVQPGDWFLAEQKTCEITGWDDYGDCIRRYWLNVF